MMSRDPKRKFVWDFPAPRLLLLIRYYETKKFTLALQLRTNIITIAANYAVDSVEP